MERDYNGQPADAEVYPLDDEAIQMIQDYERQIAAVLMQEQALLSYFVRLHKLAGAWQLRREGPGAGRELVKQQATPAPVMLPQ